MTAPLPQAGGLTRKLDFIGDFARAGVAGVTIWVSRPQFWY